jgi:hypothetical protein
MATDVLVEIDACCDENAAIAKPEGAALSE